HYALWLQREHPDIYDAVVRNAESHSLPVPALRDLYPSPVPSELHNTTWLADRFCDYLERRDGEQPFFAFVGFPDPHHPFTPPYNVLERFEGIEVRDPFDPTGEAVEGTPLGSAGTDLSGMTMAERRTIIRYTYAMAHQIDLAVGRMVDGLKQAGLWDDTIVVFTSDHGDFLGDHARLRKGYTPSDALLHLPFIMRAPGADLPSRVNMPMSNVDVLPTVLAMTGVEAPAWIHGVDIAEVLSQGREHTVLAYCSNGQPEVTNYTLYDDRYRFTLYPHSGYVELFDHQEDLGEVNNLAEEAPERVDRMRRVIESRLLLHRNPILARVSAW
ncbi:MAG: sulfatase family protein, partial [Anaerolineae bacterium]